MPNAATSDFFCNYHPKMTCLGVFRGVESAPNFFMGSLCVLNKIPALKSLEMPESDTREFFSVTAPYNHLFEDVPGRRIGS